MVYETKSLAYDLLSGWTLTKKIKKIKQNLNIEKVFNLYIEIYLRRVDQ